MSLNSGSLLYALALTVAAATAPAATAATPADPFLAQLAGEWTLTGTVRGKPVQYHGSGRWLLRQGWLCLSLHDLSPAPGYQARVYFGHDAKADDYVVHWLDQFGAAGARVVGSGKRSGQTLVFTFLYAEGAFRDTLVLAADGNSGSLLLESQDKDGGWATFASYRLSRVAHAAPSAAPSAGSAPPARQ
jgi:hypothetical protein